MSDVNGSADAGNPAVVTNTGISTPPEWLGKIDEGARGVLTNKGWVDPDPVAALSKVVSGYSGLEKLMGHDRAGRTVVLPGEKATPEEIKAFQTKIGVPETPDAYKFEVGEGADQNMVAWARNAFHKAGVPAGAAAAVVKDWEAFAQAAQKQMQDAQIAENTKAVEEWRGKLGAKADEHIGNAKKAMNALGLKPEQVDKFDDMLKAMGAEGVWGVDLLAKLAADYKIGIEHDALGGNNSGGIGTSSPEAAMSALKEFEKSEEWLKVAFDKNAPNRAELLAKRQKLFDAAHGTKALFTAVGRAS